MASITIRDLKQELQDNMTKLFNDYGVFFAFSKEQFDKQKKDGVKYLDGGAGMLIPKDAVKEFRCKLDKLYLDFDNKILSNEDLKNKYILYELLNHEAFYTGDYYETFERLGEGYTIEEVQAVYRQNLNKYSD